MYLCVIYMQISLNIILDEKVKFITFMKFLPVSIHLFNVFCVKMRSLLKVLAAYRNVVIDGNPGQKHLHSGLSCKLNWPPFFFFIKHRLYLKEQLTNKLQFFTLGYLADIFLKSNEVSLSLQGKQLTEFVSHDGIWAFRGKCEFWKTCIYHYGLKILRRLQWCKHVIHFYYIM